VPSTPTVIVVSGPPAVGKSTIARGLATRLTLPLLSRDAIKEALFDTLGYDDRLQSKRFGAAAAAVLFTQLTDILGVGASCLTESNFRRTHSSEDFRRLMKDTGARVVQVQLNADGPTLLKRFVARSATTGRHPGHGDQNNLDEFSAELLAGAYEPLDVPGEILAIEATDPAAVSLDELATQLAALLDRTTHPPTAPAA
jgi:predicted kinase